MKTVLAILLLAVEVSGDRACAFVKCKNNERCVNRKFSCEAPPCPRMIYCMKNQNESLNGPSSCDNVKCSNGFVCTVKVRQCTWDACREQVARCVTEMEFHESPATCSGYKCPPDQDCILRESFCNSPPCKLLKSCSSKREVKTWLEKCKFLGCLSPHECFLRKPERICEFSKCSRVPDCLARTESDLAEYQQCRGWICPRGQKCLRNVRRKCQDTSPGPKEILQTQYFDNSTNKTLLYALLESLNNKSDVINFWVEQSKEDKNFPEFRQWLQTVKFLLGDDAFKLWLDQLRNVTASHFHRWLPKDLKDEFWNSPQESIHETQSLLNPEFKLRSLLNSSSVKGSDNLTLFYPQFRRQELELQTTPSDYYLSVMRLIEKLLEAIAPVIEHNQQRVINQLVNESAVMDEQKKISVINVLERLRDERQIYAHIINKTRHLISKVQPPVPSALLDDLIEKLSENMTSRRSFPPDNSTTEIIAMPPDYPDNETEFILVDYGDSISDLKVNQSVPRIVVRIANNFEPSPKIGAVKVDFAPNSSGVLRVNNDFYTADGVYDTSNRWNGTANNSE